MKAGLKREAISFTACFFSLRIVFLLLVPFPLAWADTEADPFPEGEASEIILNGGYGFIFPPAALGAGAQGITRGLLLDNLVQRVLIQASIYDRIFLELDYDAERAEILPGDHNLYSILYRGLEGEFLKELSLGNKYHSIEGARFDSIGEGSGDSFALRAKAGTGGLRIEGLVRYGITQEGSKRFRGSKSAVELALLDVEYIKSRFFLLPDTGVEENSLLVLKSASGSYDRTIAGKNYRLLLRGSDYIFDDASGRIYLTRALSSDKELLVYYEKAGFSVGDGALGQQAIIDPGGSRVDFNKVAFSGYFADDNDSGASYLFLRKEGFNSYWELKNAYTLEGLSAGELPGQISVELLSTATGEVNGSYAGLIGSYAVDPAYQAILFTFSGSVGF